MYYFEIKKITEEKEIIMIEAQDSKTAMERIFCGFGECVKNELDEKIEIRNVSALYNNQ